MNSDKTDIIDRQSTQNSWNASSIQNSMALHNENKLNQAHYAIPKIKINNNNTVFITTNCAIQISTVSNYK